MKRDQQLKTLNNPRASKEQLREALAHALGEYYEPQTKEKKVSLFTQCRDMFLATYKEHTKMQYSFVAMDGRALSQLIDKVQCLIEYKGDKEVIETFRALLVNLPDWYKQNAFSLVIINNKFNEIVASIRKNGEKQGITDDYRNRILNNIRARKAGS